MALLLLLACVAGPGTLFAPEGEEPLRTALFAVHRDEQGADEVAILLSNGDLTCDLPQDPEEVQAEQTAACREGARHLALRAYDLDGRFDGRFRGSSGLHPELVTPSDPRVVHATYYAVIEAFLVDIDGLGRTYAASDYDYQPDFGSGGVLTLEHDHETLDGTFTFPVAVDGELEDLSGAFHATRCDGDTQLLDTLALYPVALCL